jgi:hypothetical protein
LVTLSPYSVPQRAVWGGGGRIVGSQNASEE